MHGRHSHSSRHKGRLWAVLALSGSFMLVQLAAGWWTNSLALLADAGHLFVDAAGVGLSLLAIWFAERPATAEKTYGYYRVEILAALVNGVVLCVLAIIILVEASERLRVRHEIAAGPVLAVAVAALGVNLLAAWLLHGGARESLNVRGAYLEVLGDALSSAAVIVAAAVILLTGWTAADALASGAIALLILPRTYALLRQAVNVLLEGVPAHLDLLEIATAMVEVAGVKRVHDLHVWTLTSGREAMSTHVEVEPGTRADKVIEQLHVILHVRFGIDHTTIQIETESSPLLQITPPGRR
ncbi:MAG TPA: cation diffusion facilitator family transporter [Candidatus Methylomirabilis sp.]|nr:cation diffusion facilitator family transporter [Candidatus Methylomirabilis sp.]